VNHLQGAFDEARTYSRYHPSKGINILKLNQKQKIQYCVLLKVIGGSLRKLNQKIRKMKIKNCRKRVPRKKLKRIVVPRSKGIESIFCLLISPESFL
jgi:hypothetical protein